MEEKGPTPYPPTYEQSQALLAGHRYQDHPPTNPDYHPKGAEGGAAPPAFTPNSEYPGPNPGYPPQNSGYPPQNPGYPPQNPGYPPHNPGYPPQNPGYPPQEPGYPAHSAGYPAQNPGYPRQNPGYPAQNQGYPAPNPGFVVPPEAEPPKTVNFTVNTAPVVVGAVGPHPCAIICPRCGTVVTSKTRQNPSITAWLSCLVLAAVGCFFGCCLVPFCIGSCQNVEHYCPNCKIYLGKYSNFC